MDNQYPFTTTEEERAARRAERIAARKARERQRRRQRLLRSIPLVCLALVAVTAGIWAIGSRADRKAQAANTPPATVEPAPQPAATVPPPAPPAPKAPVPYTVQADGKTVALAASPAVEVGSKYAVLIDLNADRIVAQKGADTVIHPASMTKILTVLTAAGLVEDLTGTAKIDRTITDYCFSNGCSVVGYLLDEEVPAEELFYGTILSSGADAALALANYAAGSHEAFVEKMNEKVEELGLSDTASFTNCVGLYDEKNVCTVTDMALILKAAMENELCRKVLTTKIYYGQPVEDYPEGRVLSNWFLRRIEDKDCGDVTVMGAKTGYVVQSGNCAASYAENSAGGRFICVTGKASSNWGAIYDHVALYNAFAQGK